MSMEPSRNVVVTIDARPGPVELTTGRSAVIVVDMQNDFASTGGMFDLAQIDIRCVRAIVPPIVELLRAAREAGVVVVYLKMAFRPDLSDTGGPHSPTWVKHIPLRAGASTVAPDGSASRVLIRDTWNTEIVSELTPEPGDLVVYKHRYSGFFDTELDALLRARNVDTLLVVGATTSVCVESTVRDAMFRDYHCLVVEDCVAEPIASDAPRTNHEASLLTLQLLFASITDSSAVTSAFATAGLLGTR
jgi:ureidoacrylate peracid hydrolase